MKKTIKASIITIGDEILIGQITDTNAVFLAQELTENGVYVHEMKTVGDSRQQIFEALDCSLEKSDLILMTGGLGPTNDDLTKPTLAEYFNSKLILNEEVLTDVEEFITSRGYKVNERNRQQAMVPENCKVVRNSNGTAPGMWFEKNNTIVISMPAVPFEMKEMFGKKMLPLLQETFVFPKIIQRTVLTHGIPESHMAELLQDWETNLTGRIKLAYLPSPERLRLRLSMQSSEKADAEKKIDTEIRKLHKIIGKSIYGEGNYFPEHAVLDLLKERKKTVATAESCTGGNIAGRLTSVPGSSQAYKGSTIAYSNDIKTARLDVAEEDIIKHGAVSRQVVEAMAKGAIKNFGTNYGVATSGVAGPGGGTPEKPVGTVWIAVASKEKVFSKKYNFGKRRDINIRRSSAKALDMLRKFILDFY